MICRKTLFSNNNRSTVSILCLTTTTAAAVGLRSISCFSTPTITTFPSFQPSPSSPKLFDSNHYQLSTFPSSLSIFHQQKFAFIATRNNIQRRSMTSTTTSNNNDGGTVPLKRAKLDDTIVSDKVIGTHSGTFQADEAMVSFV